MPKVGTAWHSDRCCTHVKDWTTRAFRRTGDGSAFWAKVPRHYAEVMCGEAHERRKSTSFSSVPFLLTSNRCLVQLATSQESGQQQSCCKHAKQRWRRFKSNVRRCTSNTPLDHCHYPIQCPPQLCSNAQEGSTYFCQPRLRPFAGRDGHWAK
jgi:hypothetical protein